MIKFFSLAVILTLRLVYQPSAEKPATAPFSDPTASAVQSSVATLPAKLVEFQAFSKNNKVILRWVVNENETADRFLVEKSTDGKNYAVAALVFGSEKPSKDNYEFYEKAGNQKVHYRIQLVNKDNKTQYSEVLEVKPSNG
ncbi:MAG: hypothetical protein NTW29_09260 [Bacteroidetes bacterium]|nr:hypothetical protein [Bacteroidota bacterium]